MARYLVVKNGEHDRLFETYEEADIASREPGSKAIYCAPGPKTVWNSGWPRFQMECYMLYLGALYRTEFIPDEYNGIFRLLDDLPSDTRKFIPAPKAEGWLPTDWFLDVEPEDDAMAAWQQEDPSYDDPYDIDPYGY